MAILTAFYENGLWLSWPLFGLGVYLIVKSILRVIRLGKDNLLLSVPLLASQELELSETGTVALWAEGPLFSPRYRGAQFELRDAAGLPVASRRNFPPVTSSGFSRGRLLARYFKISQPDRYTLLVTLKNQQASDDSEYRLLFMRPYLLQVVGCIFGILLGALLTIGSLVNFLLRLFSGS